MLGSCRQVHSSRAIREHQVGVGAIAQQLLHDTAIRGSEWTTTLAYRPGSPAPSPALTAAPPPAALPAAATPSLSLRPYLRGPLAPRFHLPVSNFPRHPCAHALPRLLAPVSASACGAGCSARGAPRRTRVYFGVGEFQCPTSGARSPSGSQAGPGAADKGPGRG